MKSLHSLRIAQKGLLMVAIPLVLAIGISIWLLLLLADADRQMQAALRARAIASTSSSLSALVYKSGALLALAATSKLPLGEPVDKTIAQIEHHLEYLREIGQASPYLHEQESVRRILIMGDEMLIILKDIVSNLAPPDGIQQSHTARGSAWLASHSRLINSQLVEELSTLSEQEREVEGQSDARAAGLRQFIYTVICATLAATLGIAFFLLRYFSGSIVAPVMIMVDNTKRLAAGKRLHETLARADELGTLDSSFHSMARSLAIANKKEHALTENALNPICSLDAELRFQKANQSCRRLLSLHQDDLTTSSFLDCINPNDRQAADQFFQSGQVETSTRALETPITTDSGGTIYLVWSAFWSEPDASWFCVGHDVTERKELERIKQEFLAMVSHDLRTPLTAISGTLSLFTDGVFGQLPPQAVKSAETASNSVSRLIRLINDLLDVEKLEAGKLEIATETVAVDMLIERSLDAIEQFAARHNVTVDVEASGLTVLADPDRIIQVLVNLLSNAVKYSAKGGQVEVTANTSDDQVRIAVCDHGRGIPEQFRRTIFERFTQVEIADAKVRGGTGLGLPICRALIELHEGRIGVESEEGKGSTFWFTLPAAPDKASGATKSSQARTDV